MNKTIVSIAAVAAALFATCAPATPISANAVTIQTNYTASADPGTPIIIGASSTPQYYFVLGTFFNGAAQYKIQAADDFTVSFPDNGVPQFKLPAVTTRLEDITFTDGDYQLFFDIGSQAYTGFATVGNEGRLISAITYSSLAPLPVPEPASWTLFLAGLGLVGAASILRRRPVG